MLFVCSQTHKNPPCFLPTQEFESGQLNGQHDWQQGVWSGIAACGKTKQKQEILVLMSRVRWRKKRKKSRARGWRHSCCHSWCLGNYDHIPFERRVMWKYSAYQAKAFYWILFLFSTRFDDSTPVTLIHAVRIGELDNTPDTYSCKKVMGLQIVPFFK